jgi:hypothetical protein
MSLHDLVALVVTAALIVLAAAVHSPFAESLSRFDKRRGLLGRALIIEQRQVNVRFNP